MSGTTALQTLQQTIPAGSVLMREPGTGNGPAQIVPVSTLATHLANSGASNSGSTGLSDPVAVNQGGTGQTTYTDGQLLIGNSSTSGLTKSGIGSGQSIGITTGHGSISISLVIRQVAVSGLGTATLGELSIATDATSPTIGQPVSGGGSAKALVWANGSQWTVIGV